MLIYEEELRRMKKFIRSMFSIMLVTVLVLSLAGCGKNSNGGGEQQKTDTTASAKTINVGVTDSLGGVNPFVIDQTEINKYVVGLMFLPLVELDNDLNFQGMLADSITTEDNINFIVHIDDKATWSDGTPVTAADVEYTVRRLASPIVNNTTLMLYAFEGTNDSGFVEEGALRVFRLLMIRRFSLHPNILWHLLPLKILMQDIFIPCLSM